jgi:low affinity Fe/Cu permease
MSDSQAHRKPSEIDPHRSWFDELASRTQEVISRDYFFITLVVLTAIWAPSYFLMHSVDHWYKAFVLPAEIVTLFMVALMANHDRRSEKALHRKVDALASALAAIVEDSTDEDVRRQATELRAAVGLEDRESTDDN